MSRGQSEFFRTSNIVPIFVMLLTGFVQLIFFLTATQNSINLISQKLDFISVSLTDGNTYAQTTRQMTIDLEKRVQRLEDLDGAKTP